MRFIHTLFFTGLLLAVHAQTPGPSVASFSSESTLTADQISALASVDLGDAVNVALSAGAEEIREQLTYDSARNTLRFSGILVAPGSSTPAPPTAVISKLWDYTLNLQQVYVVPGERTQVVFTATAGANPAGLFGDLTGDLVTVTAVFTGAAPGNGDTQFGGISTSIAGLGSLYTIGGAGRVRLGSAGAKLPTAVAGPKATETTTPQVVLDGSQSSDPGNGALAYHWAFIPQPGQDVTITGADTARPVVTITPSSVAFGTYTFQLTVTNPAGMTSSDLVTVAYIDPQ